MFPSHGIGSRKDLPLPFEFALWGAAIALLVTFVVAWWSWRSPRWTRPLGTPVRRLGAAFDSRAGKVACAIVGTAVVGWFGVALYFGPTELTNPAFGWVFVCWWVGLVPLSLMAGGLWRALHPLWALARLTGWDGFVRFPTRLGVWPAAAGIVAFAWLELVAPERATQPVLGAWVAAYWLAMTAGVAVFGRDFLRSCDPFIAYSDLVSTLSPWQRVDGVLTLVNPLRHLATSQAPRGAMGVIAALLAATAFDSASGGVTWIRFVQQQRWNPVLAGSVGLAIMLALVGATLALSVATLPQRRRSVGDELALTMTPIVVGYALGHYASMLILEGQRTLIYASDPLGRGWNVFGTAELGVWSAWLDYPVAVAVIQLLSIVTGHVVAVLCAHDACLRLRPDDRRLWPQLPLLAVMVFYTVAGLTLLFSA